MDKNDEWTSMISFPRSFVERCGRADYGKSKYWSLKREMGARVFEQWVKSRLLVRDDYLVNILEGDEFSKSELVYPYLFEEEKGMVFMRFDKFFGGELW
jgi:hypothetical protein